MVRETQFIQKVLTKGNCIDCFSNKLLQQRQGVQLRRKNMKTLLALIALGVFSFSLAYKRSYVADGGYNLIRDYIFFAFQESL